MTNIFKRSSKAGLPPGSLIHVGEVREGRVRFTIFDYDKSHFSEKEVENVEECFRYTDNKTVTWINIDGIHQVDVIEKIGLNFGLTSLVLEDILNTNQRPKLEDFENYIYVVMKMISFDEKVNELTTEQVSFILAPNLVISFQERIGDTFDPVRGRLRAPKGRIRKMDADYLAYALIDSIVDNYFIILEKIGEKIDFIEEELVTDPTPDTLTTIHELKREMISLKRSIWPLREILNSLRMMESSLIMDSTHVYLKDVHDHIIQIIDTIETYKEMLSGMLDIYLSSLSNKMNEVMKVLTLVATIFIPLTFIAGVYGMNFQHMPELGWKWSYPVVWLIMISVGMSMVLYFKKMKWI
ncbi:magnesium/cobalt transporter CorA [Methanococcoides burtonii]|uniref:Magnesium transport protein CorA n=1 Tax=Methanococcoides burtonii (strain DSM 6242 / NBRC 107633 / OCM 468 / ACE-M) TaxID=259564 RepID=Q12Y59_METBU|nr:magnesium/cobalt transporter CorA [Methanococcoides burtonii]ABE51617.1 Divalent metal ion transporter CorA [Methanococcoides burtonii DSM 6242]